MARLFRLAPLCDTPDEAIDWFEAQGATGTAALFRGPDGFIRGAAELPAPPNASAPTRWIMALDRTFYVLKEVFAERIRQERRWGEQNHADGTGGGPRRTQETIARDACERAAREGRLRYLHILEEEFAEAAAQDDPAKLRGELIQVAAVAVAWVETIDRRAPDASGGDGDVTAYPEVG